MQQNGAAREEKHIADTEPKAAAALGQATPESLKASSSIDGFDRDNSSFTDSPALQSLDG